MCAQYVNHGAKIKCSCGSKIANLHVLPDRTVTLTDGHYANISDHQSMVNIPPFGVCRSLKYPPTKSATDAHHGSLTPMPCKPGTYSVWENGNDTYIIRNFPALLTCSSCRCIYGGVITIVTDGQIPNEYESEQVKTLQQEVKEETSDSNNSAGLDVIDFIPVVGSIRDIGEGIAAGSIGMVALGTVFLVADVAGIVGSVFSGGAATVGVTAAKSSIKAGVKVAAKSVAKESAQQAVKQGEKKLLEVTAKTATAQAAKQAGNELLEITAKTATAQAAKQAGNELLEITAKTATAQAAKQAGNELCELTARGATDGATKLSVEAIEELGEEALNKLNINFFHPNIFKVEAKIAETGAKEATKSPAAISQVTETLKPFGDSSKGMLETGIKQIDDIAKAGREYIERGARQLKEYLSNNEINRFLNGLSEASKRMDILNKEIERLSKITKGL